MSEPTKTPRPLKNIAVPVAVWDKARRMASAMTAQGVDKDIGEVASDAILALYDRLPADTREFIESQPVEAA